MTVSIYAALLAFIFVFLTALTIKARYRYQQRLGDGGKLELSRYIRAHANFAEYTPFFLILLVLAEMQTVSELMIHVLGALFVIARISHAYSIIGAETYEGERFTGHIRFRQFGMVLTIFCITIVALLVLMKGLR